MQYQLPCVVAMQYQLPCVVVMQYQLPCVVAMQYQLPCVVAMQYQLPCVVAMQYQLPCVVAMQYRLPCVVAMQYQLPCVVAMQYIVALYPVVSLLQCLLMRLLVLLLQCDYPMRHIAEQCPLFWGNGGERVGRSLDARIDFHFNAMLDNVAEWKKKDLPDVNLAGKIREMHQQFMDETQMAFTQVRTRVTQVGTAQQSHNPPGNHHASHF